MREFAGKTVRLLSFPLRTTMKPFLFEGGIYCLYPTGTVRILFCIRFCTCTVVLVFGLSAEMRTSHIEPRFANTVGPREHPEPRSPGSGQG